MKITFIRGTALGGVGKDAFPGDVLDLPEAQAKQLIALGRAREGGELKKAAAQRSRQPAAPEGNGVTPPAPDSNANGQAGE